MVNSVKLCLDDYKTICPEFKTELKILFFINPNLDKETIVS